MPSNSLYERLPEPPVLKRSVHVGYMPVPWVTCYTTTSETVTDTPLGAAVTCTCVFGEGKPGLGYQCPTRQRAAMLARRCNACGTRIKGVALFAGGFANVDRLGVPKGTFITAEAGTHPRCLAYSALACPALFNSPYGVVVPVMGAYPVLDEWELRPLDESQGLPTIRTLVPHNTPRPVCIGGNYRPVHEYVYARLDLPGQKADILDHWMRHGAPQPYRTLWQELVPTLEPPP